MRAVIACALFAIAVPNREPPPAKEQPKSAQEQLLGEWRMISGVLGGTEKKDADGVGLTFTRTEIQIREPNPNRPDETATYVLDEKKKPTTIDILPKNGPNQKVQGILKVEGDKLTLCFAHGGGGGGERPTAFASPVGSRVMLMVLQRVKK